MKKEENEFSMFAICELLEEIENGTKAIEDIDVNYVRSLVEYTTYGEAKSAVCFLRKLYKVKNKRGGRNNEKKNVFSEIS